VQKNPDCVLLDYNLPDLNGLEFLGELRNDPCEIPVAGHYAWTGADNAQVAVEAMKCGAQDYLVKDSNRQYLELLPAVIQRVAARATCIDGKKTDGISSGSGRSEVPFPGRADSRNHLYSRAGHTRQAALCEPATQCVRLFPG